MRQHGKHFVQFLLHFHLAKPLAMEPPLMPALEELPEKTQHILLYLRTYLKHLPKSLPKSQKGEIPKYPFGTFRIDRDLLEHTGDYVGAINETFKRIFGWKTRTTGDGILNITERGEKDIGAVADLLEGFLKQYPDSEGRSNAVLEKWAEDITNGCIKAILDAGEELPDIPATVSESYRKRKECSQGTPDPEDDYMTKRRKLSKDFDHLILKAKSSGKGAKGKPSIARLAVKYVSSIDNSPYFGCTAEKCSWLQDGNASEDRLLKHAADCKHLSPENHNYAVSLQAGVALGAKVGTSHLTRSKASVSASTSILIAPAEHAPEVKSGSFFADFTGTGQKELQTRLDHCIMKLICVCGVVPNILDSDEWREFMSIANLKYKVTSSSTFRDKHIPREAAHVHQETVKILRNHHNLTFTFDGNNTRGHESVYTGHFTTPNRQTFLFCGYGDTTYWKHKKGRELAKAEHPILSVLPDACHHISLTIGDITKLEEFKPMIDILKATIQYFSHSDSSTKKVEALRKQENITKGLVTIGKTRFATHYTAAVALERCFPVIRDLTVDKAINFKNKDVAAIFTGRHRGAQFQLSLAQYIQIVGPLARSLWALESAKTNAAHVFLFWLAMGAELKDLFERDVSETEIEPELARKITQIFNSRYRQFIEQTPDDPYFTAFYLDPRYIHSDLLLGSSPGTIPVPTITIHAGTSLRSRVDQEADQTLNPKAYRRVKKALKEVLRCEVELWKEHPLSSSLTPLMTQVNTVKVLAGEFVSQLITYSRGEYPFSDPVGDKSVLEWWTELGKHPKARVLAYLGVKAYSALANSMADERTGSRFTWFNSALRNRQKVNTLVDMTKIGQCNLASKKAKAQKKAHDRKKQGDESDSDEVEDESNPQVKLIDLLDQQEATEDVDELDLSTASADNLDLDCDVNLRSSFLRNVLPKDMSGQCPVLEGGSDIPSTGEDTQSEFVGDEYVDWVQL
ncbi:ribonuclease H-like domain-containing protein [Lentinula aff. lateritia]|uniref:Ribonuclease H-like domain-containing protein n=1 Tax=Lentinula aff. lateritia TaxID=2804960 RepID=A0ACC1TKU5_9AGAR|nr:ribonuclease H-like domain-containing protein [Lentinula aff. lateritia]